MPETILGLDIGSDTIKAVLAIAKGRMDIRVLASETVRLEDGVDLDAALKKLAETIRPDGVVEDSLCGVPAAFGCHVSSNPPAFP